MHTGHFCTLSFDSDGSVHVFQVKFCNDLQFFNKFQLSRCTRITNHKHYAISLDEENDNNMPVARQLLLDLRD